MLQIRVVEKIKTLVLCSVTFFPKIVLFMRYCGKIWLQPDKPQMTI